MSHSTTSATLPQQVIVQQCEAYLTAHGDTHQGVGWPHYADAQTRYQVIAPKSAR